MAIVKDPNKANLSGKGPNAEDAARTAAEVLNKFTAPQNRSVQKNSERKDFADFGFTNLYLQAEEVRERNTAVEESEKPDGNSLSGGKENELFSLKDLLSKGGILEEFEIFNANTQDIGVRDLPVGVITNSDKSRVYMTGPALDKYITNSYAPGQAGSNFSFSTVGKIQREIDQRYVGKAVEVEPGKLNPDLAARMNKNPELKKLVEYAINSGESKGLNGVMFANQLWQESRFNPRAQSGAGAMGIAQMMPFQQGKFGLQSREDFFDPYKSIDAGAQMMARLTDRYKDQRLALVAYNGGGKAIDFVESKLGKDQVTFNEWYKFMADRRETLGTANKSAWHVETLHYTEVIAGKRDQTTVASAKPQKGPEPVPA